MGSDRGRAVTRLPAHGDQARPPLVPVLAPLRIAPPRGPTHAHDAIRTQMRGAWTGRTLRIYSHLMPDSADRMRKAVDAALAADGTATARQAGNPS
jgi:hypothetical protein